MHKYPSDNKEQTIPAEFQCQINTLQSVQGDVQIMAAGQLYFSQIIEWEKMTYE